MLSCFNDSVYRQGFTVEKLEKQLLIRVLVDVIHVELPEVTKVTTTDNSVRSI